MMPRSIEARLALENLPLGTHIVACGVEGDGTAYGHLLEHTLSTLGNRYWKNLTVPAELPATAGMVVARYDDMVVTREAVA